MADLTDPPGEQVAAFIGRAGDAALVELAEQHFGVIAEFVNAYVRGNGVTVETDGSLTFPRDMTAVIVSATARLVDNPAQLDRSAIDDYSAAGSFRGFSLPELAVLNRYRRRAA